MTLSGLYTPAVYVYEKAVQEMGVSKAKASIILSILGIFDTCGRAASGLLADRWWADSLLISSVATIMAGILTSRTRHLLLRLNLRLRRFLQHLHRLLLVLFSKFLHIIVFNIL